jgi:NAD(P)H-dependent FMN reductase
VIAGANDPDLSEIEVVLKPALITTAVDILEADGYLLGTPANFGYMSGALKHMFDQIYYPCLDATGGRPFGFWVHGNDDTTGAVRAISTLTSGLGWRPVAAPVTITGPPDAVARAACRELGATVAANLL